MLEDINQLRERLNAVEAQLQAADAELRIAAVLFETQEAVIVTNARGIIVRVNQAFSDSTGYSSEEIVGKTPQVLKSGHHDAAFYGKMWENIRNTGRWEGEIWDRRKNGEVFLKRTAICAVADAAGVIANYVAIYTDITERRRAENKIHQLAFYDALTRLPNRTMLLEALQRSMDNNTCDCHNGAVLLIDLDHFKHLNDSLGHKHGDMLLQQVARRLRRCVQKDDMVARIGGDEFAIVITELCDTQNKAAHKAEHVAENIITALSQGYTLGSSEYRGTASIGVAIFAGGITSTDEILKQAEMAMYKAKADGRNRLHYFDAALEAAVNRRIFLERELGKAITDKHFVLHYQPQVAKDGTIYGAEALVRWQHPERGLISPLEFIPLAEETGHILALGAWVLEDACQQLAKWGQDAQRSHLVLAVNVSPLQFMQEDFVEQVREILQRTAVNPQRLKLELTESLMVGSVDSVIERMHQLKNYGLRLALDDFGTGYSSLSYLKRMPLDQLKIDQSFVREVLVDANAAAIAQSIAALAHSLGLALVAEGVEMVEQRDVLAEMGCCIYQGYYYSRPLPLAEFENYLLAQQQ